MRAPIIALAAVCTIASVAIFIAYKNKQQPTAAQPPAPQQQVILLKALPDKNVVLVQKPATVPLVHPPALSPCNLAFVKPRQVQTALITGTADTVIHFLQGTAITVHPQDFVNERTGLPVTGAVQLQVSEHYQMEDILTENLSTVTKNGLLETNGMVNIKAITAGGEVCKLKKDGTIDVQFPDRNDKPGMQLFTGVKDNAGNIIWEPVILKTEAAIPQANGLAIASKPAEKFTKITDTSLNTIPQFPGGISGIARGINSLKNPFPIKDHNTFIMVDFNVDTTGKVCHAVVKRTGDDEYALALKQAVYNMKGWQPALVKGREKLMTMRLAVSFSINNPRLMRFYNCVKSPEQNQIRDARDFYEGYSGYGTSCDLMLTKLVFTSTRLGWINCDRFYNSPAPKTDLYVAEPPEENKSLKLIFHNIKSVMSATVKDGKYVFTNIPVGEPVTVIALTGEEGHLGMALKTLKVSYETVDKMTFSRVTAEEVKQTMQQFNKLPGSVAKN